MSNSLSRLIRAARLLAAAFGGLPRSRKPSAAGRTWLPEFL